MNERIQKLYDQADKFAKENRTQTISGPGNNYFELFHEKFAELIVKECVGILSANEDTKIKMGLDEPLFKLFKGIGKAYADGIKEHFGVE